MRLFPVGQASTLSILAFTGYCHYQYCMGCIAIKVGRGETLHRAIVSAMKGGSGVPKQRGYLRVIVLILVQRPITKRISCKGQYLSVSISVSISIPISCVSIRTYTHLLRDPAPLCPVGWLERKASTLQIYLYLYLSISLSISVLYLYSYPQHIYIYLHTRTFSGIRRLCAQ